MAISFNEFAGMGFWDSLYSSAVSATSTSQVCDPGVKYYTKPDAYMAVLSYTKKLNESRELAANSPAGSTARAMHERDARTYKACQQNAQRQHTAYLQAGSSSSSTEPADPRDAPTAEDREAVASSGANRTVLNSGGSATADVPGAKALTVMTTSPQQVSGGSMLQALLLSRAAAAAQGAEPRPSVSDSILGPLQIDQASTTTKVLGGMALLGVGVLGVALITRVLR